MSDRPGVLPGDGPGRKKKIRWQQLMDKAYQHVQAASEQIPVIGDTRYVNLYGAIRLMAGVLDEIVDSFPDDERSKEAEAGAVKAPDDASQK